MQIPWSNGNKQLTAEFIMTSVWEWGPQTDLKKPNKMRPQIPPFHSLLERVSHVEPRKNLASPYWYLPMKPGTADYLLEF